MKKMVLIKPPALYNRYSFIVKDRCEIAGYLAARLSRQVMDDLLVKTGYNAQS